VVPFSLSVLATLNSYLTAGAERGTATSTSTRPGTTSAWDMYAIHTGQWTFDLNRMTGVLLPGGLPVEEALFFLVIPVCAVLTFEGVRRLRPRWAPQSSSAAAREELR